MIEQILPHSVVTVATEGQLLEGDLFPEEEATVRRAVEKRRREFVTGRVCARLALRQLGIPACGIPSGALGEPIWPDGVIGSITHCDAYRASTVARTGAIVSVGIDAEVHESLPRGVLGQIATPREYAWAMSTHLGICVDRLIFSAKEAVYKAWFPLTRRWLGFEDAEVSVGASDGTFRARLLVRGPVVNGRRLTEFCGRWRVERNVILTAVVLPGQ